MPCRHPVPRLADFGQILAGAVIGALVVLPMLAGMALEYVLGFAFGWTISQALFMRDAYGGSYRKSLAGTFLPELLSMNLSGQDGRRARTEPVDSRDDRNLVRRAGARRRHRSCLRRRPLTLRWDSLC